MKRALKLPVLLFSFFLSICSLLFSQNLPNLSSPNSLESLQGQIAGLTITPSYLGVSPNVLIRGYGTWNNNDPLYVIDGLQTQDVKVFNSINLKDIQSVSVLKDAAAAIYGSRGANGVIVIRTKRGGRDYGYKKPIKRVKKKKRRKKNLNNK
tara:strand:- start:243 stop:698 length:456 start_codon:yes stop_codon:yes gene_type:complete